MVTSIPKIVGINHRKNEFPIDIKMINRATKALRDSPFNPYFYKLVSNVGITAQEVSQNKKTYLKENSLVYNSSDHIESKFLKLIKVGILRREVDGQGLTSKVRLTPLGRGVLQKKYHLIYAKKNQLENLVNCIKKLFISQ